MSGHHQNTEYSPNRVYMHEIIHLEPPDSWKKQIRKKRGFYQKLQKTSYQYVKIFEKIKKPPAKNKDSTKSYKNALNQFLLQGIWKGKSKQQKPKILPKATGRLQKEICKVGKEKTTKIFNYRCLNIMMDINFPHTPHSPNHVYAHKIIQL